MRCPDYDNPTKITDETEDEYLCEYCGMRGVGCDGKGNITYKPQQTNTDRERGDDEHVW